MLELRMKSKTWVEKPMCNTMRYKQSEYNYTVSVNGGVIVANFISDAIVYFTTAEWKQILDIEKCEPYLLSIYTKNGFLIPANIEEKAELIEKRIKDACKEDVRFYTILPTQHCNARCKYCFSQQNKPVAMTREIAEEVVAYVLNDVNSEMDVKVNWFGGEPLLNIQAIDYITTCIREKCHLTAAITTNGSLINNKLLDRMIRDWRVFRIVVPVDGYEQIHNKRKNYINKTGNAYRKLLSTIDAALQIGLEVVVNLNYDRENYYSIPILLKDLHKHANNPLFYLRPNAIFPPEKLVHGNTVNVIREDYDRKYFDLIHWLDEWGFNKTIEKMIPKRMDSGCSYSDMHSYVISADGSILKCARKATDGTNSIGSCKQGLVKNREYYHAVQTIMPNDVCLKGIYLPICQSGCILRKELALDGDTQCNRNTKGLDVALKFLLERHIR